MMTRLVVLLTVAYLSENRCKWENRSVIMSLLGAIAFEVTEAVDGQDGLNKAAQVKPDLIITDLTDARNGWL